MAATRFRDVAPMTNHTLLPEDEPGAADLGFAGDPTARATPAPWSSQPDTNVKVMSAGGLVFRQSGSMIETLLCARARPGFQGEDAPLTWRLPKGTPELGETVEQTAQREVQEETGVRVNVLAPITSIRYFFVGHDDGVRYDKTVYFYLMEPLGRQHLRPRRRVRRGGVVRLRAGPGTAGVRQRAQRPGSGPRAHRSLPGRRGVMSKDLVLRGVRVLLRGKRLEDAEKDYIWRSDPEIARLDAAYPLTMKYERYLKLFQDQIRWPTPGSHHFAIEAAGGKFIGNCMYYDLDSLSRQAELGIVIGDRDYWSGGYGYDAVVTLLNYMFGDLGLKRVYLHTLEWNHRAQKCFRTVRLQPGAPRPPDVP